MTPKTIDFEDDVEKVADLIREYGPEDGVRRQIPEDGKPLEDHLVEDFEESFLSGREYQVAVLEAAGVPRYKIAEALDIKNISEYYGKVKEKARRAEKTISVVRQSW